MQTPKRCPECGRFLQQGFKEVWARQDNGQPIMIYLGAESCPCGYWFVEPYRDKVVSMGLKTW